MSKYDAELRRRLAGSEDLAKVVDWYLQQCIKDKLEWKDCTVFEVRFMKQIDRAFTRWNWRRHH
jgi:hypothetical protein